MNNNKIVYFDLETTGLNIETDQIVQIGIMIGEKEYNYKIKPAIPISVEASNVHHILEKDLINCLSFKDVAKEIFEIMNGQIIGGYNIISFDIPLLINEFKRCDIIFEPLKIIDVFNIWKNIEGRKLTDCFKRYCPDEPVFSAHDALEDVRATQMIFSEMITLNNKIDYFSKSVNNTINNKIKEGVILFGKYKNKHIKEVYKTDPQYISWMINNITGIKEIIVKELGKIKR